MSKVEITRSKLDNLAVAISNRSGVALPLTIAQMQTAVENIPTGTPPTLVSKNITANGTYNAASDNADGYSSVSVNVPIPEGYIIPTGNLTIKSNGTDIDVAEYATVSVAVPTTGTTNFASGTFTVGTTEGTAESITIPYSGGGYPIMLTVVVEGGAYKPGTPWFTALKRYAVGQWTYTKCDMTTTPNYSESTNSNNWGVYTCMYKNSAAAYSSFGYSGYASAYTLADVDATGADSECIRFKGNGTTLSYYVANGTSSGYGLLAGTTYRYFAVYSS